MVLELLRVCVCVCVCARARVCAFVCVWARALENEGGGVGIWRRSDARHRDGKIDGNKEIEIGTDID